MPFYECFVPEGAISQEQKAGVAAEITRIHCAATGAPESFVNVVFHDIRPGDYFVAGRPATAVRIRGNIRAGRTQEVKARMLADLSAMWTRETGLPEAGLTVTLVEFPAANSLKGGRAVPEPGQEAAWLAGASAVR